MPIITRAGAVANARLAAQELPVLLAQVAAISPDVATQLETKPLLASRTPWGTLAAAAVGYASARWGLGLDANTDAVVGGFGLLVGAYLMRLITGQRIAGIVATPAPPAPPAPAPLTADDLQPLVSRLDAVQAQVVDMQTQVAAVTRPAVSPVLDATGSPQPVATPMQPLPLVLAGAAGVPVPGAV